MEENLMEQGDVIELLDTLYSMISEAWGVPLGNDKCIIEREKALDLINEIKASMPSALAEAKRLVAARDEFIGNAKKEAVDKPMPNLLINLASLSSCILSGVFTPVSSVA